MSINRNQSSQYELANDKQPAYQEWIRSGVIPAAGTYEA